MLYNKYKGVNVWIAKKQIEPDNVIVILDRLIGNNFNLEGNQLYMFGKKAKYEVRRIENEKSRYCIRRNDHKDEIAAILELE